MSTFNACKLGLALGCRRQFVRSFPLYRDERPNSSSRWSALSFPNFLKGQNGPTKLSWTATAPLELERAVKRSCTLGTTRTSTNDSSLQALKVDIAYAISLG